MPLRHPAGSHAVSAGQGAGDLDVAALVRQPGTPAPLRAWRPRALGAALWQLFGAARWSLFAGLLLSVGRAGLLVGVSLAVGRLLQRSGPTRDGFGVAVAAALGLLAAAALGWLAQRLLIQAIQDGLGRWRRDLVEHQMRLPLTVVETQGAAPFVLALTRDAELLGQMGRACFAGLLPSGVLALASLAGLVWLVPSLAGPLALGLLGLGWLRRRWAARLADRMRRAHGELDALYGQLGGLVQRQELAVSHAGQEAECTAAFARIDAAHAATRDLALAQARTAEAEGLVLGLGLLGMVCWLAAGGASHATGALASLALLLMVLRGALQGTLRALQEMSLGVPALQGLQALRALPTLPDHGGRARPVDWAVSLRGVRCEIDGHEVLGPVDLDLAPGRICVVTGANGAGKTTLLRLLLGLVSPRAGQFTVDGVRWPEVDLMAYRQGLAYLPQHSLLFPGTVLDNLRYTAPQATPEAAWQALVAVGLDARLGALGLERRIGPGGSPLSGGERQRLALARLWLRPARLVVLDEPTNHLDAAAVGELAALLRAWPGAPGVLVISHDPALLALADDRRCLVKGCLVPS